MTSISLPRGACSRFVWKGEKLSTDEKDGAWESGYEWTPDEKALAAGVISRGSGTAPTLMGFGDDPDKLVVIADAADAGTNAVAFWRDNIPADFKLVDACSKIPRAFAAC